MSDRKLLDGFKWREPSEEEKKRLAFAKSRNKAASYVLLGVVILMIVVPAAYINDVISMFRNNSAGAVISGILFVAMIVFLISRIHLVTKYKVADVVVDEIVKNSSTDNGNYVTATVTQGKAVLTGVTVAMKEDPEVGSSALLCMENNDTWTVGIV